jgi:hypothetical protein
VTPYRDIDPQVFERALAVVGAAQAFLVALRTDPGYPKRREVAMEEALKEFFGDEERKTL